MLRIDPRTKTLELLHHAIAIQDWLLTVEANGKRLEMPQAQVEIMGEQPPHFRLRFPDVGLVWTVRGEVDAATGTLLLRSNLENRSDDPIALGKVYPLEAGPVRIGQSDESVVCLPFGGGQPPRIVARIADPRAERISKIKAQFYNRTERQALQVGFISFQRANTEVRYDYSAEAGLHNLKAFCDFDGWLLQPGESTPVETFILAVGTDPYAQLEHWADLAVAAAPAPPRVWEDAPIGWVGFSWVDSFTVERYEDVVLRNAEAIARRLKGFGVNYIWVSIGNIHDGNPGDWLNWNENAFPGGHAYLSDRLRQLGIRLGLWCAPFWLLNSLVDKMKELEGALLKAPDGSPLIAYEHMAWGQSCLLPIEERPDAYTLDPTHPKALDYVREVFETYREWGVRYYMIDFLEGGAGNMGGPIYKDHHDKNFVAGPEAYLNLLRVVRKAAGDDTYLLASSGPTMHNLGFMDGVRTGNDFGGGLMLYPENKSPFYGSTYVINSSSLWDPAPPGLINQAASYYTHRKFFINDSADMLTVDKPVPLHEARVAATIHGMSGGPTMIGDDLDRMDEERLALIKKTLPRSRDVAFPVDLFDSVAPDYPKIFQHKVKKDWGEFDVVAVYNFASEPLKEEIALERLRLKPDAEYIVWEFWNEEYVGLMRDRLTAQVPPGSVRIYRLVENTGRPVVLATDLHMTMGEMEIESCAWDEPSGTLSGRAVRPSGERGNVFLWAPKGLEADDPHRLWLAKDNRDHSLVVKIPLRFGEEGRASWSVRFIPQRKELPAERRTLI